MREKNLRSEQCCYCFPEDLIISIFERLPAKSILRFRCVSKTFGSLIHKSSFLSAHLKHSHNNHDLSDPIHTNKHSNNIRDSTRLRLIDLYDDIKESLCAVYPTDSQPYFRRPLIGYCNGVFCLSSVEDQSFCLWNPILNKFTRRQSLQMPHWNSELYLSLLHVGFGYDSRNNQFKLVRVFRYYRKNNPELIVARLFKISGFGNTNEWTVSDIPPPPRRSDDLVPRSPAYLKGASHWLVAAEKKCVSILSFHFADEVFDEMPLPPPLQYEWYFEYQLTECDGMLCLCNVWLNLDNPAIWIMKVYGDPDSWVPLVKMIPPLSRGLGEFLKKHGTRVVSIKNEGEDVLICNTNHYSRSKLDWHSLYLFNLKTLELRELNKIPEFFCVYWEAFNGSLALMDVKNEE